MTTPDVSVLVVTYNSDGFIDRCITSVREQTGCTAEVVVADNASPDDILAVLAERWPDVRVIEMGGNTGFARANNAAAKVATGRHVLLLNGDAWLEPGTLCRLVDYLDAHPDVGVVAPHLLYADGTDQRTARSFPTPAAGLFGRRSVLSRWFPNNRWTKSYLRLDERRDTADGAVDWVSGACLMTPRELYLRLGGLDEGFFMHWEDTDYCHRVHKNGLGVRFLADAPARHDEGSSRKGWPAAQIRHFHYGAYRYYAKHHLDRGGRRLARPVAAAALALRALLLMARNVLPVRATGSRRSRAALP